MYLSYCQKHNISRERQPVSLEGVGLLKTKDMTRGELNYLARQVAAAIEVPVTTEKLAELTGWTVCAINNMVARKEIPVIHFGTRRMFSPSAVRQAIINNDNSRL